MSGLIGAGADLGWTLLTILDDMARGIGALVMLLWVIGITAWRIAAHAERKRAAVPDAGPWVDKLIADIGMCPFCQVRGCNDPRQCTCDDPCPMPLCQAKEVVP